MSATHVVGTGAALPEHVLPSRVLDRRYGLADGTVAFTLGVQERRVAAASEAASDLALGACQDALAAAGAGRDDVRLLLLATSTPDHITPATAPLVAHRLGLTCAASDVTNTCSGFVYALALADRYLRGEEEGAVALVAGANVLSRRVDWKGDWRTAALFGDGAGAVALRAGSGAGGVLATALVSDGSGYHKIQVPAGGSRTPLTPEAFSARQHLLQIPPGAARLQDSLELLLRACHEALDKAGLEPTDVDRFVPHQASARLMDASADRLGIPSERVARTLARTGNTSSASIPIALHEDAAAGRLAPGDKVLLGVVAGGMTAGAAVVEWTEATR